MVSTTGLELPLYLKVEFDDTLLIWMDTATRTSTRRRWRSSPACRRTKCATSTSALGPVQGGELPYLQQQNWPVAELAGRQGVPAAPSAPLPTEEQVAATVGDLAES